MDSSQCIEISNNYCLCIISIHTVYHIDITESCISGKEKWFGYKRNKSWKT